MADDEKKAPAANAPGDADAGASAGEGDAFSNAFAEFAGGEPKPDADADASGAQHADDDEAPAAPAPAAAARPDPARERAEAERERDAATWERLDDAGRFGAYRAAKGRARSEVSTLARRAQELERELEAARAQLQRPQPAPARPAGTAAEQPTAEQIAAATTSPAAWELFSQDYPEVASALDARLEAKLAEAERVLEQRLAGIDASIAPVRAQAQQQSTQAELEELAAEHADWQEITADQAYWDWLSAQSESKRALANSPYGADVALALTAYKKAHPERASSGTETDVQRLQREREERLRGSASSVQTRPRGNTRPTDTSDFSGAFAAYAAQAERQQNAR